VPEWLSSTAPQLRQAFIRHRFEFECDCPRCTGARCDPDGQVLDAAILDAVATKGAPPLAADAALEQSGLQASSDGVQMARGLHRQVVSGVQDEKRQLIGLQLKQYGSFEEALGATDDFWRAASDQLAVSHWMRHQVRSLRCLCLLELRGKAVNAVMLLAEHLAAERLLVPRAHFQRLHTWRQVGAAAAATRDPTETPHPRRARR